MKNKLNDYFGMKHVPFSKSFPISELFQTESIKQVNDKLKFALQNEDIAVISGVAGSGKSTAIRNFVNNLDPASFPHVYMAAEAYKIGEVAKIILEGLRIHPPYNGFGALRKLKQEVEKMSSERGMRPVIIIDEAHELPIGTLSSLKNLTNFSMDSQSKMLIILCGQNELINNIQCRVLSSLRRRIRIRHSYTSLTNEECSRYVEHHMKTAGVTRTVFTEECKAEIFKLSQGVISNVNNICLDLLLSAAEKRKEIIEISQIKEVCIPE
jgi:general secretion pathway protein A